MVRRVRPRPARSIPGIPKLLSSWEAPDLELAEPVLGLLLRVFIELKAASWRAAEPGWVTPTQGAILFVIATVGRPLCPTDLAKVLSCSRPTVSRSVASLERKGYVTRVRDRRDRRRILVRIGRSGHLIAEWVAGWDDLVATTVATMPSSQRNALNDQLVSLLRQLRFVDLWTRLG